MSPYRTAAEMTSEHEKVDMTDKEFWLMQWKRIIIGAVSILTIFETGYFINNRLEWNAKVAVSQNELAIEQTKLAEAWARIEHK